VDPLQVGSGSFHAIPSVALHRVGRFDSPLEPFRLGPRQCGQFSAEATPPMHVAATSRPTVARILLSPAPA
jgi:hypothetical protein